MDAEVEQLIACVAERFTARRCSVEDMNFSSLPGPKIIARNWVYPITKPVSIGITGQNDIDLGPSHHLSGQQAALSYDYDAKTWWLETKSDEGLLVNGTKWSKGDSGRLLNGAVIRIDEIEMMVVADGVGISIHRIYVERVGLCPRQVSQTLLLLSFFHARSTQDRHTAFSDRLARHDLASIQTVWKAVYGLEYAKVKDLGLSRRSRPTDEVKRIIKEERNLITKSPSISSTCHVEGKALKAKANLGQRGSTLINASKRRISVRSTPSSVFSLERHVPTINDMPDAEFKHQELPWVLRERPVRKESSGTNLFTEDEDELGSQLECLEKFRTGDGRGFGLRTTAPISADSFVIEYTGRRVPEGSSSSAYQMALGDGWVIDASRGKARLINHSCRPNCCAEKKEIKGRTRIAIRTLKAIRPGEELTFNYRTTTGKKIKCRCSRGCTRNLYIPG